MAVRPPAPHVPHFTPQNTHISPAAQLHVPAQQPTPQFVAPYQIPQQKSTVLRNSLIAAGTVATGLSAAILAAYKNPQAIRSFLQLEQVAAVIPKKTFWQNVKSTPGQFWNFTTSAIGDFVRFGAPVGGASAGWHFFQAPPRRR